VAKFVQLSILLSTTFLPVSGQSRHALLELALDCDASAVSRLTANDLSRLLDLSPRSCRRILLNLRAAGYISRLPDGSFRLSVSRSSSHSSRVVASPSRPSSLVSSPSDGPPRCLSVVARSGDMILNCGSVAFARVTDAVKSSDLPAFVCHGCYSRIRRREEYSLLEDDCNE